MRKLLMIVCLSVTLLTMIEACSNNRPLINCEPYKEAIDPAPDKSTDWEAVEKAGTDDAKQKLELLNQTVAQFNILSKPKDTEALINHGKKILKELSRSNMIHF